MSQIGDNPSLDATPGTTQDTLKTQETPKTDQSKFKLVFKKFQELSQINKTTLQQSVIARSTLGLTSKTKAAGEKVIDFVGKKFGWGRLSDKKFQDLKTDPQKLSQALGKRKLSNKQFAKIKEDTINNTLLNNLIPINKKGKLDLDISKMENLHDCIYHLKDHISSKQRNELGEAIKNWALKNYDKLDEASLNDTELATMHPVNTHILAAQSDTENNHSTNYIANTLERIIGFELETIADYYTKVGTILTIDNAYTPSSLNKLMDKIADEEGIPRNRVDEILKDVGTKTLEELKPSTAQEKITEVDRDEKKSNDPTIEQVQLVLNHVQTALKHAKRVLTEPGSKTENKKLNDKALKNQKEFNKIKSNKKLYDKIPKSQKEFDKILSTNPLRNIPDYKDLDDFDGDMPIISDLKDGVAARIKGQVGGERKVETACVFRAEIDPFGKENREIQDRATVKTLEFSIGEKKVSTTFALSIDGNATHGHKMAQLYAEKFPDVFRSTLQSLIEKKGEMSEDIVKLAFKMTSKLMIEGIAEKYITEARDKNSSFNPGETKFNCTFVFPDGGKLRGASYNLGDCQGIMINLTDQKADPKHLHIPREKSSIGFFDVEPGNMILMASDGLWHTASPKMVSDFLKDDNLGKLNKNSSNEEMLEALDQLLYYSVLGRVDDRNILALKF